MPEKVEFRSKLFSDLRPQEESQYERDFLVVFDSTKNENTNFYAQHLQLNRE